MNADLWACINCGAITELSNHGRCGICDSDAVVRRTGQRRELLERLYPGDAVTFLEALYERSGD